MNKKIYTIIFLSFFLSCKPSKNEIIFELKEVDFIYTKPQNFINNNSNDQFESYIFYKIEGLIKNETEDSVTILLNDLMTDNYSFDFNIQSAKKNIPFYNYPFSGFFYPVQNSAFINPKDSLFISLQSPLISHHKKINQKGIDSLFNLLKASHFKISGKNINIVINEQKIRFHLISFPPKNFFSVSNAL